MDLEQVVFNNLEAVPESLEVVNCFEEVSLFKVHQRLRQHSGHQFKLMVYYIDKLIAGIVVPCFNLWHIFPDLLNHTLLKEFAEGIQIRNASRPALPGKVAALAAATNRQRDRSRGRPKQPEL